MTQSEKWPRLYVHTSPPLIPKSPLNFGARFGLCRRELSSRAPAPQGEAWLRFSRLAPSRIALSVQAMALPMVLLNLVLLLAALSSLGFFGFWG